MIFGCCPLEGELDGGGKVGRLEGGKVSVLFGKVMFFWGGMGCVLCVFFWGGGWGNKQQVTH